MTTQERIDKMLKKSEAILNAGKQTNEEWLKSASTEELAEVVYSLVWLGNEVFTRLECSGDDNKESDLKIVREWLKEKHTE